jgi:hypothetical protein
MRSFRTPTRFSCLNVKFYCPKSFLPKNSAILGTFGDIGTFSDIGTFGDKGTEIKFIIQT